MAELVSKRVNNSVYFFRMSTVSIEPCYIPLESDATQALPELKAVASISDKLTLVIPTLHEAESLRALLDQVRNVLSIVPLTFEILVVDDDSQDGTEELVNAISLQDPRVRLVVRKGERGLSGAILHGWQNCDSTILGVMDADLQHPPDMLPYLVNEILRGKDIVIGSRYARGGCLGDWNPVRRLLSAIAVWITFPLQSRQFLAHDPMSGFFLVRRRCLEKIEFQPTGFKLLLEILVRGRIRSLSEVPISFGRRTAGCSKASLHVAWEYLQLLGRLYATRLFQRPLSAEDEASL